MNALKSYANVRLVVVIALVGLGTAWTLESAASAQCVTCKTLGSCFFCTPSTNGGCTCWTTGCTQCNLGDPCAAGHSCIEGSSSASVSKIVLSQDAIREIAGMDTEFGRALVSFRGHGAPPNISRIYITPVQVTPAEFEWWLRPENESAAFFKRYLKRVKRAYALGATPVEFEVAVSGINDSGLRTINLHRVVKTGDQPAHSSLTITISSNEVGASPTSESKPQPQQVLNWQFGLN
jgi:hypothetical protein